MFVPDQLKTNGFYVLGLSVESPASDVHKAVAKLKRAAALAVAVEDAADMPALGEGASSEQELRMAVGRLENAKQRATDRVFWFHQAPGKERSCAEKGALAQFDDIVRAHDAALYQWLAVCEDPDVSSRVEDWIDALLRFHAVVSTPAYGRLCGAIEEHAGFEPMALPSEIDAAARDAVQTAAEPLLVAARAASLHKGDAETFGVIMCLMGVDATGPWAARAQDELLAGPLRDLREACERNRKQHGTQIAREVGAADFNRRICARAVEHYRTSVAPALARIRRIVPSHNRALREAQELTALTLHALAADYTWAEDFVRAEALNAEAREIARGTRAALRIEQAMGELRGLARRQRLFGVPLTRAPSLSTVNGIGCRLYGRSDYDSETNSYVATHYFVFAFIPVFPLARYRVIEHGARGYRFVGKLPLTKGDRLHTAVAGVAVVLLAGMLFGAFDHVPERYGRQRSVAGELSLAAPIAHDTSAARARDRAVAELLLQIEQSRRQIALAEQEILPIVDQLRELQVGIERRESQINSLDTRSELGARELSRRAALIQQHDRLVHKSRRLRDKNKGVLDEYRSLVDQHNRMVGRYNELTAGSR